MGWLKPGEPIVESVGGNAERNQGFSKGGHQLFSLPRASSGTVWRVPHG